MHLSHTERMTRPLHACARVMSVMKGLMGMEDDHLDSLSVQVQYKASRDLCMHAVQVMSVVKGLMKTGMTICATIHSPTPFCFRLFDRMMILLRGHMVYAGPNGGPPPRKAPIAEIQKCPVCQVSGQPCSRGLGQLTGSHLARAFNRACISGLSLIGSQAAMYSASAAY